MLAPNPSRLRRVSLRTWRFCARTVDMFVIPRTKQMESRMLDFPLPFRPVMELKLSSLWSLSANHLVASPSSRHVYHPEMTVRTAYDLKPCGNGQNSVNRAGSRSHTSMITSMTLIFRNFAVPVVKLLDGPVEGVALGDAVESKQMQPLSRLRYPVVVIRAYRHMTCRRVGATLKNPSERASFLPRELGSTS
jgi:hypothetical protein